MIKTCNKAEKETGNIYGRLFPAYDEQTYLASINLFRKRFAANGFPLGWFRNKVCFDAGSGNGRYSIALSLLGAKEVFGLDVSREAVEDSRRRAQQLNIMNVKFQVGSVERVPFPDNSFDAVISSGVLQYVANPERAMSEISRVLRPKGLLYILVYSTEGIRGLLVQMLRPLVRRIGFDAMDEAVRRAGFPPNKRYAYLDNFFVPFLDFYPWGRFLDMLKRHGFEKINRWNKGRFDNEENLDAYFADLDGFRILFKKGAQLLSKESKRYRYLFHAVEKVCSVFSDYVSSVRRELKNRRISEREANNLVIGQGLHRVIAWRSDKDK